MGMVKYSQSSQNSKFAISLRYLQKKVRDGVDILHPNKRINIKVSYKLISYLTSMIKHSQSIQSGKFVISLQYLQKKSYTRNGVLHADKHQKFRQVGIIVFDGIILDMSKIPRIGSWKYFC